MDVELYEVVLSYRRGQRLSNRIEYGFNEAQLALRQDMAAGRLIWYDNLLQDWWCFLRNTHPVFAAFASHQLHVVGKVERYWIYGMLICAYWLMAALAVETRECMLANTCDVAKVAASSEGFLRHVTLLAVDATGRPDEVLSGLGWAQPEHSWSAAVSQATLVSASESPLETVHPSLHGHGREPPDMYMCCMVQNIGLVGMYARLGGGFVSFIFAVLTVVLGQMWFLLAACGCCQFARPAVRHRWERISHMLLFTCGVVALTSFLVAYSYMARARLLGAAWLNFGLVKGASISGAFVLQSLLFLTLYRKQRNTAPEALSARFHVTVADVLRCDHVRQKLGLPPLDVRFRMFNAVLPDLQKSRVRWRLWLRSLELSQLVSAAFWCVCAIWLAASLIAIATLVAVYVQHRRHFYPQLYRYAHSDRGNPLAGSNASGVNGSLGVPGWADFNYLEAFPEGSPGAMLLNSSAGHPLPLVDLIRGPAPPLASGLQPAPRGEAADDLAAGSTRLEAAPPSDLSRPLEVLSAASASEPDLSAAPQIEEHR